MKSDAFARMLASPWLNLVVGLVLLISSGWETIEAFTKESNMLATRHGVLLFSIVQVLKALPDLMEALRSADESSRALSGEAQDDTEPRE